ncbi:FBD-associated F-box protein At5g38590-like [Sesamum indicum]|uniref:FBD-associated F-box protein At5g38590-like n=1 Tax=Sesamum indicum TaxID=4182 RepID=A0A8M8UM19_SESIN|nr:FBD-associated F-box protein At5g38590-like [Sesamum indicum]
MLWKRICLGYLVRRGHSTKRSSSRRGTNDRKNLMLKPIGSGFGDGGVLGKRKIGHLSVESNKYRVRKKRKIRGDNGVCDRDVDVDRISELPEPIIHHIYGFMHSTKDVVRTSILSKKWKSMFSSYLTFDFDQRWFRIEGARGKHNRIKAREVQKKKFRGYVEKSLALRLDPVPCIDKFRLYVNNMSGVLQACMGRWICAAVDKNVKELDVHVNVDGKQYFVPEAVLLSASITSLKLSGSLLCDFGAIKLSNLRELSIKDTFLLNGHLIKRFEESCPLLEDLRLVCCRGLLHLAISALLKLRRLEVHECAKLSCIEIEASNLETFWYHAKKHQQCKIDLKSSGKLKNLTMKDRKMTDTAFQDCISKSPLLEKLVLHECTSLETLTILSGKLRSLSLINCANLREANIDAPNLYSFQYSGRRMPFSSMNVLGLCEAKFSFGPIMKPAQRIVEYHKLFGSFNRSKGFKLIVYSKQNMKIYEEPGEDYVLPNYFCKLELTASSRSVLKTVDNWLRECHGRSIVLVSPSTELIKFMRTMIIDREDNPNCCRFYSNKCWRHYVADVKILTLNTTNKIYYDFKWRSR